MQNAQKLKEGAQNIEPSTASTIEPGKGAVGKQVCSAFIATEKRNPAVWNLRTLLSTFLAVVAAPVLLVYSVVVLGGKSQVFVGFTMALVALLPFVLMFERKRPQARELVLIAVMVALAVASRIAFFMLPQFKPMAALVIVAGVWLGPETGFLVGMMSAFVSNFFFGQGPWTPWQMLGFGLVGLLAGLIFNRVALGYQRNTQHNNQLKAKPGKLNARKKAKPGKLVLAFYGFAAIMLIYGPLVDTSSAVYLLGSFSFKRALPIYVAGMPANLMHASATALFLYALGPSLGSKLIRMQRKFGLIA